MVRPERHGDADRWENHHPSQGIPELLPNPSVEGLLLATLPVKLVVIGAYGRGSY